MCICMHVLYENCVEELIVISWQVLIEFLQENVVIIGHNFRSSLIESIMRLFCNINKLFFS